MSLKGEKVDLVILEKINEMKKIKNFLYLALLVVGLFMNEYVKASRPDSIGKSKLEFEYAFSEATKQFVFGNYQQALVLYLKCIENDPSHAASLYQLGNIYMLAGDSHTAIDFARRAYKIEPDNKWIALLMAKTFQLNDKNDSALLVYRKLMNEDSQNMEYRFEYASLLANASKYKEALEIFNDIEKQIGINEGTSLAKQQIYVEQHMYDQAVSELKKLIAAFPDEPRYMGMLAEMYSAMNQNDKAEQIYDQIFKVDSTNALALVSVADFYRVTKKYEDSFKAISKVLPDSDVSLESKVGLIIGYLQNENDLKNNPDQVKNSIQKLISLYPANIKLNNLLVDYYAKFRQYDSAIVVLEKVLMVDGNPDNWEQYFILLSTAGKNEKIIQAADKGLKYDGKSPTVYLIIGLAYLQEDSVNDAIIILKQGYRNTQMNAAQKEQYLEVLGEACFKGNDYICSDSCYESILKENPKNIVALNNYAYYLSVRGSSLDKALKMSRITIKQEPSNATYLDTYAYILLKQKKYHSGYKWMKKAVEADKEKDADILEHMGDALFFLGKKEEAKKYWEIAIKQGGKVNLDQKMTMTEE